MKLSDATFPVFSTELNDHIDRFLNVLPHLSEGQRRARLHNVTPADVYFGWDKAILQQRERIKRKTLETRSLHHKQRAAWTCHALVPLL